jgi:hypothetical protein
MLQERHQGEALLTLNADRSVRKAEVNSIGESLFVTTSGAGTHGPLTKPSDPFCTSTYVIASRKPP